MASFTIQPALCFSWRIHEGRQTIALLNSTTHKRITELPCPIFFFYYLQLTGLSKILQAEMAPSLRSLVVLPLQLGCERDETLVRLTEGRVPACTHDLVPDLLRTKPDPQAEQRLQQFNHKASTLSFDTVQVFIILFLY